MKGITIGNFRIWHNKAGYCISGLKHYIIPHRLTLKCNVPIYQWLWFAFMFVNEKNGMKIIKGGLINNG